MQKVCKMPAFVGWVETPNFYPMKFFTKIARSITAKVHRKDALTEAVYIDSKPPQRSLRTRTENCNEIWL